MCGHLYRGKCQNYVLRMESCKIHGTFNRFLVSTGRLKRVHHIIHIENSTSAAFKWTGIPDSINLLRCEAFISEFSFFWDSLSSVRWPVLNSYATRAASVPKLDGTTSCITADNSPSWKVHILGWSVIKITMQHVLE